jgi:hypothetical protein
MTATLTALSACPAFAMAMWLRQRSHTSIGASTAGTQIVRLWAGRADLPVRRTQCIRRLSLVKWY